MADQTIVAELSEAIGAAQQNASVMVAEVRRSNWGAATPAYIACDTALKTAIVAVSRLLQSSLA
jgi:phenylpyruvate tautomerase PptA (4-oxalocrotonate tautomerase family)